MLRKVRKKKGQGAAELVGAIVCLVPVILVVIDLGVVAIGAGINDAVCRDAARAAASGPPSELTLAENRVVTAGKAPHERAMSVIKRLYATNVPAKLRDTIEAEESVRDIPPAPTGGAVDGEVSIKTTIDIYPPFIVGAVVGNSGVSLSSKHSVAITYVMPPSGP